MVSRKLIFFGSSPFSTIVLEKLLGVQGLTLYAMVTTPDKPVGRHLKLTPNPVKVLAQKNGIPVFDNITPLRPPLNLRGGSEGALLGLVAAYGQIIKQEVLDKFNGQIYNIHPSLLPKYRGPSPLQQQILDGITETGVTIIQLDTQMDHGPIVAQEKDTILPTDTWTTLGERLFEKGADLFLKIQDSRFKIQEQDHSQATYTKKLTRQSGFVEFEKLKNYLDLGICDLDIARMLRAYEGWPGVWTLDPTGKHLKLISLNPEIIVQPEGKSSVLYSDFHSPVV